VLLRCRRAQGAEVFAGWKISQRGSGELRRQRAIVWELRGRALRITVAVVTFTETRAFDS
jgi:hypothetical protein